MAETFRMSSALLEARSEDLRWSNHRSFASLGRPRAPASKIRPWNSTASCTFLTSHRPRLPRCIDQAVARRQSDGLAAHRTRRCLRARSARTRSEATGSLSPLDAPRREAQQTARAPLTAATFPCSSSKAFADRNDARTVASRRRGQPGLPIASSSALQERPHPRQARRRESTESFLGRKEPRPPGYALRRRRRRSIRRAPTGCRLRRNGSGCGSCRRARPRRASRAGSRGRTCPSRSSASLRRRS